MSNKSRYIALSSLCLIAILTTIIASQSSITPVRKRQKSESKTTKEQFSKSESEFQPVAQKSVIDPKNTEMRSNLELFLVGATDDINIVWHDPEFHDYMESVSQEFTWDIGSLPPDKLEAIASLVDTLDCLAPAEHDSWKIPTKFTTDPNRMRNFIEAWLRGDQESVINIALEAVEQEVLTEALGQ